MSLYEELRGRGFIEQETSPEIKKAIDKGSVTLYVGFDPTASSLHLGHLLPIVGMARFQKLGHKVIALVGGATGMIGDPSGKSTERTLLTLELIDENKRKVKEQLSRFLAFDGPNAAIMVDNFDWIGKMSFIDWLRDVGKHFSLNYMTAKTSVKKRMESEQGISYTEFSYMTLQAYDFLHLRDAHGCTLQCGGSDQWGNITAGIDLVRKLRGEEVFGLTFPLITTSSGEKFGKSAGNAVWLDAKLTSPYAFYQFWLQTADQDVERYLKLFSFFDLDQIAAVVAAHAQCPEKREGQKALARELTSIVHGPAGLAAAEKATAALFGAAIEGFTDAELAAVFADVPSSELPFAALDGKPLVDLLAEAGVFASKGEARRLIAGGGVSVNNRRVETADHVASRQDLASESMMVVRKGKKNYHLIKFK